MVKSSSRKSSKDVHEGISIEGRELPLIGVGVEELIEVHECKY